MFTNFDTLSKLSTIVQWTAIILVFLGGTLQASKYFIDKQINTLRTQNEELREKERLKKEEVFKVEISELHNTAKSQEEKLSQIHDGVKNRQILTEKLGDVIKGLSLVSGQEVTITNVLGDQEAFAFANQLKGIFQKSGWKVNGVNQAIYSNSIKGVIIVIKDKSNESAAQEIYRALRYAGIDCVGEINDKQPTPIGLVVGAK